MSIFQHLNFWGQFLALLGFLIIMSIITRAITATVLTRKRRIYIAGLASVLLTVITLLLLQGHSVFFKQEGEVISKVHEFKNGIADMIDRKSPAKIFFEDNFIFINTSLNPSLITLREGNEEDSSRRVITNRAKLVSLLHFINNNRKDIDMVACDIVFPDITRYDTALVKEFQALEHDNKLVLAYNKEIAALNNFVYKEQLDPSVFGDVTKMTDEPFYFSHSLLNEDGLPSFPYSMYIKLKNPGRIKTGFLTSKEGSKYLFKNFITEFNFTEEHELYTNSGDVSDAAAVKTAADTSLKEMLPASVYTLGNVTGEFGQEELLMRIKAKKENAKNIIFIGNISDEYIDRHATAHGILYGATILLNEFYYINNGHHIMSAGKYIFYIITLMICFFWVLTWMLWKAGGDAPRLKKEEAGNKVLKKTWMKKNLSWLTSMFGFLLEEFHHFWLFLFVFLVDLLFHKLINVMGLIYIFLVFSALLKFYIKLNAEEAKIKLQHNKPG